MKYLNQKGFVPIMFGGLVVTQVLTVLSYTGYIGMNLGALEPAIWLMGAAVLFNESALENGKALGKLSIFPVVSFAGFALAAAYGLGLATGMADLVGMLSPYKVPLLSGVLILEMAEAWVKG